MPEIGLSGSEGGGAGNRSPYPYSRTCFGRPFGTHWLTVTGDTNAEAFGYSRLSLRDEALLAASRLWLRASTVLSGLGLTTGPARTILPTLTSYRSSTSERSEMCMFGFPLRLPA